SIPVVAILGLRELWPLLSMPTGPPVHSLFWPFVLSLAAMNTLLLVAFFLVAILFFGKRTSAPVVYIFVWVFMLLGSGAEFALLAIIAPDEVGLAEVGDMAREAFKFVVWTAYMRSSVRVRTTFVRRLRAEPPAGQAQEAPQQVA